MIWFNRQKSDLPIIFSDKSCIHSTPVKSTTWSDGSLYSYTKKLSKAQRLTMTHASSETATVPNAPLVFNLG